MPGAGGMPGGMDPSQFANAGGAGGASQGGQGPTVDDVD